MRQLPFSTCEHATSENRLKINTTVNLNFLRFFIIIPPIFLIKNHTY